MNIKGLTGAVAVGALLIGATANAQFTGVIAEQGCTGMIPDNLATGGELYVLKTHNAGGGPDFHKDWLFDLSAKSGGKAPGVDVGGPMYSLVGDRFNRHVVPPEELFIIVTYPNGWMAIDSAHARGLDEAMGVVQLQHVGDSLPAGIDNGIGLMLPGTASQYSAGIADRQSGTTATFPYGTSTGIEVAFSPIAEINTMDIGGTGCTVGGEIYDEESNFGLITGYNVYRIDGPAGRPPTTADFVGNWQYYCPFTSFDLNLADTAGASGPDLNGDTMPDGDGAGAPNDGLPDDLCGLQNPDGIPYSGDEVIIYQDSYLNPDGTARRSGTGPVRGQGYWYAFQPVAFQGRTVLGDYDGSGFSDANVFVGQHSLDTDADGIAESLDVDLDGSRDFYSPHVVIGETGLGLTNGGLPLLSSPVHGQINPAVAIGSPRITARVVGDQQVNLTFSTGFEMPEILGYQVMRHLSPNDIEGVRVNSHVILANGGDGNVYQLTDRVLFAGRFTRLAYSLNVLMADGSRGPRFGPFVAETTAPLADRRRR